MKSYSFSLLAVLLMFLFAGFQEVREQGRGPEDPREGGPLHHLAQGGGGGE